MARPGGEDIVFSSEPLLKAAREVAGSKAGSGIGAGGLTRVYW